MRVPVRQAMQPVSLRRQAFLDRIGINPTPLSSIVVFDTSKVKHTGMVLKKQMVAEKDHELTRAKDFLTSLLMKGHLLSADALFTLHTMCHEAKCAETPSRRLHDLLCCFTRVVVEETSQDISP